MPNDNKKYIPVLRFPEFQNDGEWKRCKLSDIAIRKGKKNTTGVELPVYTNSATSGVINQEEYFDREIVTKDNLVNYGIIESNDFVYNPRISVAAPVGPISRNKLSRGIMSPLYLIFGFNSGDINFFEHYFKGNSWHSYLRAKANYGARFDRINIGTKEFMDMPVPYPSLVEQKKIADCLSSLDKYIDATKRKLELLKEHKKGLMQKLFPAKGKTTPDLRFLESQNDRGWKVVRFGELFTFISNNTLSRANLNNNGGIVQNIHYGDVLIKYKENLSVKNEKIPFITDIKDIQKYIRVKLENGDIIIADTAEDEIVGKCTEIQDITKEIIVSGLHTIAIRPNCKFAKYYLGFYLNSQSYRNQLTQFMQGVKVLAISKTSIAQTTICFPVSLREQELITNCLMEINNSLNLIEEKIKILELHKKGLMQQLFPKL